MVEGAGGLQGSEFLARSRVDTFGKVNNEGTAGRGAAVAGCEICFESDGVCPAEIAYDPNREIFGESVSGKGVVMAHGGDAAEKIAQGAEPDASRLRNALVAGDGGGVACLNVPIPVT